MLTAAGSIKFATYLTLGSTLQISLLCARKNKKQTGKSEPESRQLISVFLEKKKRAQVHQYYVRGWLLFEIPYEISGFGVSVNISENFNGSLRDLTPSRPCIRESLYMSSVQ